MLSFARTRIAGESHELSQLTDGGGPRGPWPVQLRGELPEAELAAAETRLQSAQSRQLGLEPSPAPAPMPVPVGAQLPGSCVSVSRLRRAQRRSGRGLETQREAPPNAPLPLPASHEHLHVGWWLQRAAAIHLWHWSRV